MSVAPDQNCVRAGFSREDLFVAVHEQFLTETARYADVVLPATMFVEHDDIYKGGGHQYIVNGPKLVEPPGECRSNHEVRAAIAARVGAEHPGFAMSPRDHIDWMLTRSGLGGLAALEKDGWIDCQPPFEEAHFLTGFGYPDGRYRFSPDWANVPNANNGPMGPVAEMPPLPDHWEAFEAADTGHPFRLATPPARSFLNSTFNETPTSVAKEGRPEVVVHPEDAARIGIADGGLVRLSNARGSVDLHARVASIAQPGVLISEGLWPNGAFVNGMGINVLTGADPVAPYGGVAFHDNHVNLTRLTAP
jgi:anaerobic selenocysteine-containing dehydrogenase